MCIGTTVRPNSALIVVVGDSVNAVATVAIITIAVAVMVARISSSTLGSICDCEISYSMPVHAACDFGHSV